MWPVWPGCATRHAQANRPEARLPRWRIRINGVQAQQIWLAQQRSEWLRKRIDVDRRFWLDVVIIQKEYKLTRVFIPVPKWTLKQQSR